MPKAKELDERLEIRVPRALVRQAKQQAKVVRKPLSEIIRELLTAWLGQKA